MVTQKQHPIEYLFNERKNVAPDHYGKVIPVPEMIAQTAFFSGGSGLWLGESRSLRAATNWPPMPKGKVMVLGNDFGPKSWHEACLQRHDHDLNTNTWRNLLELLLRAGIKPKNCFFTNAYMGLRITGKSTGQSPGAADPEFVKRCASFFLDKQITVQKPRLILALGKHAIEFIAGLSPDLAEWKECKTFPALDNSDVGPVVKKVHFNGSKPVTVVALVHPAGRNLGNTFKNRRYRGAEGEDAELKMLKSALKKSGLKK